MKLAIIAAALIMPGSAPLAPAEQAPTAAQRPAPADVEMPNIHQQRAGCMPVLQQVREQAKRSRAAAEGHTLDREPPANLLLAVDRHVDGCREVTFIRRNIGSNEPGR